MHLTEQDIRESEPGYGLIFVVSHELGYDGGGVDVATTSLSRALECVFEREEFHYDIEPGHLTHFGSREKHEPCELVGSAQWRNGDLYVSLQWFKL